MLVGVESEGVVTEPNVEGGGGGGTRSERMSGVGRGKRPV